MKRFVDAKIDVAGRQGRRVVDMRGAGPRSRVGGSPGSSVRFSFQAQKATDTTVTMREGSVRFGCGNTLDKVIDWVFITGASTTITVEADTWFVWLKIELLRGSESATWIEGSAITQLTAEESKHMLIWPLVQITSSGDVIQEVVNLQCGDVYIPRSA